MEVIQIGLRKCQLGIMVKGALGKGNENMW